MNEPINEIVSNYLSSGDADKFVREFAAISYNIHKNGDQKAIRLVNKIESMLADLHGGFILKSSFQEALQIILKPQALHVVSPIVTTGSNGIFPSLAWPVDWREAFPKRAS